MMNLKSFAEVVVLGLITLCGTAQAQDKSTERPNVKVGDRWVFVTLRPTVGTKLELGDYICKSDGDRGHGEWETAGADP